MGGVCDTHGRDQKCVQNFSQKTRGKETALEIQESNYTSGTGLEVMWYEGVEYAGE
jgi:hypothetical protein